MAIKSIGKILSSDAFWKEEKEAMKYIHHQFQDYGYRLAIKLGDIQHKAIYIKLAKTTPRHLIEKAAAFASDFPQEPNKGKLFMWQLKKLREEEEEKYNQQNFTHAFAWQKIWHARENLIDIILKKESERNAQYLELLKLVKPYIDTIKKGHVIDPLSGLGAESSIWTALGWKYTSWESNRRLIDESKKLNGDAFKSIYKKDPVAALIKLKQGCADIFWLPRLWELLSFETQQKIVTSLTQSLKPGGLVVVTVHLGEKDDQRWEMHNVTKDQKVWIYQHTQTLAEIEKIFSGFELIAKQKFDNNRTTFLWRLLSN